MDSYDKEFIYTLNEYYPFERYIFKKPHQLNYLFDDMLITEFFVPSTETTKKDISNDGIYIKVKGNAGEMRLSYFDFAPHIREEIRIAFYEDFGQYQYECLYVDHKDNTALKTALNTQISLLIGKYNDCTIKDDFKITDTIELIKELWTQRN